MSCVDCSALLGKPATVEPHGALHGERARARSDGVLEHFKCLICGTLWERFEANRYFKREPQVWRLRPATNQSVWASTQPSTAAGPLSGSVGATGTSDSDAELEFGLTERPRAGTCSASLE